jgi:hypothetical protein
MKWGWLTRRFRPKRIVSAFGSDGGYDGHLYGRVDGFGKSGLFREERSVWRTSLNL